MRICRCHLRDQIILMSGERQIVEVHPFAFPLVSNTMATSADFASASAEERSVPASNCTFAPGAFARIAFKGEVGNHICCCHAFCPCPGA